MTRARRPYVFHGERLGRSRARSDWLSPQTAPLDAFQRGFFLRIQMPKPKFSRITLDLIVESSDVQPVRRLLIQALDTIHNDHAIFTSNTTDKPTRRPASASEYDID